MRTFSLAAVTVVSLGVLLGAQPPAQRSASSGVYSQKQAASGKELYLKHCASCHGEELEGKFISDSSAPPPLRGERFLTNWTDVSVHGLLDRIRTTMPTDTPGSLKDQEYLDIVAFLLEQNAFPSGSEPLPSDADGLKAIVIKKDR
jgi:mono/diheme cytochrome c family protein